MEWVGGILPQKEGGRTKEKNEDDKRVEHLQYFGPTPLSSTCPLLGVPVAREGNGWGATGEGTARCHAMPLGTGRS